MIKIEKKREPRALNEYKKILMLPIMECMEHRRGIILTQMSTILFWKVS